MKNYYWALTITCLLLFACTPKNSEKIQAEKDTIDTTVVLQSETTIEELVKQRIEEIYTDVLHKRNIHNYPSETDLPYLSNELKSLWKTLPTDEESGIDDLWANTVEWDSLSLKTVDVVFVKENKAYADVVVTSSFKDGQPSFDVPVRLYLVKEKHDGQEPQWYVDDSGQAGEQVNQMKYSVRQQFEER